MMQAILLAAGKSTRTYPLTLTRPKPLLRIGRRTLLEWNLDALLGLVDEVILVVGYRAEMIQDCFGGGYKGIKLSYCLQREQLGTGHAVLQAEKLVRGPFFVLNGDDLYERRDLRALLDHDFAALAKEVEDPRLYGVYRTDEAGRVQDLAEKPENPVGNLANIGCYKFLPTFFEELRATRLSKRGEFEITSAILSFAKQHSFYVVPARGYWLSTGFAWDLLKNMRFLFSHHGALAARDISANARVHQTGTLIAPVYVADGVEIGPGAVVGPFTSIDMGATIGAGAIISGCVVMQRVVIGEGTVLLDSVAGAEVQVQAGVRVATRPLEKASTVGSFVKGKIVDSGMSSLGTILGDCCVIGAGALIEPGVKVWPGEHVGYGVTVSEDVRPLDFEWR